MTENSPYTPPGERSQSGPSNKKLKCKYGHHAIFPTDLKSWFKCEFDHSARDEPEKLPD